MGLPFTFRFALAIGHRYDLLLQLDARWREGGTNGFVRVDVRMTDCVD